MPPCPDDRPTEFEERPVVRVVAVVLRLAGGSPPGGPTLAAIPSPIVMRCTV